MRKFTGITVSVKAMKSHRVAIFNLCGIVDDVNFGLIDLNVPFCRFECAGTLYPISDFTCEQLMLNDSIREMVLLAVRASFEIEDLASSWQKEAI